MFHNCRLENLRFFIGITSSKQYVQTITDCPRPQLCRWSSHPALALSMTKERFDGICQAHSLYDAPRSSLGRCEPVYESFACVAACHRQAMARLHLNPPTTRGLTRQASAGDFSPHFALRRWQKGSSFSAVPSMARHQPLVAASVAGNVNLLAAVLLLTAGARPAAAQGAWIEGQILTNYGSSYDGKSPWEPSWGTLEVRAVFWRVPSDTPCQVGAGFFAQRPSSSLVLQHQCPTKEGASTA